MHFYSTQEIISDFTFRLQVVTERVFSVKRRISSFRRNRGRRELGRPVARVFRPGLVSDAGGQNRISVLRFRSAESGSVSSRQRVGVVGRQVVEVSSRQRIGPVRHRVVSGAAHPGQGEVPLALTAEVTTGKRVCTILEKE